MGNSKDQVIKQWPNLKKEWADRIATFLDQQLAAQDQAIRSTYEGKLATLQGELADVKAAHKYEASQRDTYAAQNAALLQQVGELGEQVKLLGKVVQEIPLDDIEIALMPSNAPSRTRWIGAVKNASDWLDLITMAKDVEGIDTGIVEPEGEAATILTDTALPDSVVAKEPEPLQEPTAQANQPDGADTAQDEPVTDQTPA